MTGWQSLHFAFHYILEKKMNEAFTTQKITSVNQYWSKVCGVVFEILRLSR